MIDTLVVVVPAVVAIGSFAAAKVMPTKREQCLGLACLATLLFIMFLVAGDGAAPGECTRDYGGYDC